MFMVIGAAGPLSVDGGGKLRDGKSEELNRGLRGFLNQEFVNAGN